MASVARQIVRLDVKEGLQCHALTLERKSGMAVHTLVECRLIRVATVFSASRCAELELSLPFQAYSQN